MVVNAAPGLGSAIAQGEVAPDRYILDSSGNVKASALGGNTTASRASTAGNHSPLAVRRALPRRRAGRGDRPADAAERGRHRRSVEIEWAADEAGIKLLQARPLRVAEATVPDEIWLQRPRLDGHPRDRLGLGTGLRGELRVRARARRAGDVLVTTVAGPALGPVLAHVAGVVAELGGSTSIWRRSRASAACPCAGRARGDPAHPGRRTVAVDGVAAW